MTELKTQPTDADVDAFLASLPDDRVRQDCQTLRQLMEDITGAPAKMWGSSIMGFGTYHYKYKSGREGDWMVTGFSPRKANLTIYIMNGYSDYQGLLAKLGKHTTAKSCLYIKKLSDVDLNVLRELITRSVKHVTSGDFLL
jgi:hypothetical protein